MNRTGEDDARSADEPGRSTAAIRAEDDLVTFVQIWEVPGVEGQQRWLAVMHESIDILQRKAGFVSMTLHASTDGERIAVYAQWSSTRNLEAAITDREAVAAHDRMAEIGSSEGSVYVVDHVYGPSSR